MLRGAVAGATEQDREETRKGGAAPRAILQQLEGKDEEEGKRTTSPMRSVFTGRSKPLLYFFLKIARGWEPGIL